MRYVYIVLGLALLAGLAYFISLSGAKNPHAMNTESVVKIIPIQHATAVIVWGDKAIYTDPEGGAAAFAGQAAPSVILITDIHQDHLDPTTLSAVLGDAALVVPQAVKDQLPEELAARATVMQNGETIIANGFTLTAIPMYNIPESEDAFHTKGRGNGYVIEKDGERVYVAGDTAGTPEMRALQNIDIALVPMNLPYTMDVDEAADAVLAFAPKHVYPYHYRGTNGLSDVNRFEELVNAGNSNIDVVLLDWYQHR